MVKLQINNKSVSVPEKTTILDAAASIGIKIPTLCYLKGVCDVAMCRVCVVEIEGDNKLSAACNTVVEEGMVIQTNSRRVREARKVNIDLILADHNSSCTACERSGNCELQMLAESMNIPETSYENKFGCSCDWPQDYPLLRDDSKCVKCMRCVKVCDKVQSLAIWDTRDTAMRLRVDVAGGKSIKETDCALCGQCIKYCPVGALNARNDSDKVFDAISDPEKVVVFQVAPAVRTAWAESQGLTTEEATEGKMAAAIRALGVDYVFDTNFTADLTIMEEGSELLERLGAKEKHQWPMFTSCCPGWVSFAKTQYPEMLLNLSTAKSPQQMFGAAVKTWFAKRANIDPKKIFSVSVMPCVAKKNEITLPDMDSAGAGPDVDVVITSRELARMIRSSNIDAKALKDEKFDDILGEGSGAAVIFGATSGVCEAALRTVYYVVEGKNPPPDMFKGVRLSSGIIESEVTLKGNKVRVAIASGLGNARALIEKVKKGEAMYDFIEVMACPGGCINGGGQPIVQDDAILADRAKMLYKLDEKNPVRFSHENKAVQMAYKEFFEKPLSHKSHDLLHTEHKVVKK